jgi:hypothetical protein
MRWRGGFGVAVVLACLAGGSAADVVSARFADPTNRYPHNVLGALRGFGALEMVQTGGTVLRVVLPEARVFEDIAPRLWDITGDGVAEVVVVESDATRGARLVAYGPSGVVAASDFIGTQFRWLAPLGVADVLGRGTPQVVWVETPHLGKTLRVAERQGDRLVVVESLPGVTAHRIGDEGITGGVRPCAPQVVALSPDWARVLRIGRGAGGGLVAQDAGPNRPGAVAAALRCP